MNNFRRVAPIQQPAQDPERSKPSPVDGGYRGDVPPHMMPSDASPSMNHVRFEQSAIRKDFGARRLGSAAISKILGLGEHKFITEGKAFERLIRLIRSGTNKMQLEVLTLGEWQIIDTSAEDINDVYLSTVSIQGVFLIADGLHLFMWSESIETNIREDDFPAGNSITDVGQAVTATIGAQPVDDSLRVAFSSTVDGTSVAGITLKLGIERNGVEFDEKTLVAPASSDPAATHSWVNQQSAYTLDGLADSDEVTITIKEISAVNPNRVITLDDPAADTATKVLADPSIGDNYTFHFSIDVTSDTLGAGVITHFEYFPAGALGYIDSGVNHNYGIGSYVDQAFTINAPGMTAGDTFRIFAIPYGGGATSGDVYGTTVTYEIPPAGPIAVSVHGLNRAVDLDTLAGLQTDASVANVSTLAVVAGAPAARLVYPFETYAVALRNGGDTQTFSWSVDGNVSDWVGESSGQLFLVSALSDPIDDLTGFATLGNGVGVLFRRRSIMRVFLTGNVLQSIGVVRWIERLGTDASFSIQSVLGGVMYLGSDFQVYLLDESSNVAVGMPIHQDLIRSLTGNLDLVDSAYDEAFHEYVLGVPENGASRITRLWYFDVMAYRTQQKMLWRTRVIEVERLATSSKV